MSVVVVISQHLLNVFVQLANKRGFKKKKLITSQHGPPENTIHSSIVVSVTYCLATGVYVTLVTTAVQY
jgi:hypothetical protein